MTIFNVRKSQTPTLGAEFYRRGAIVPIGELKQSGVRLAGYACQPHILNSANSWQSHGRLQRIKLPNGVMDTRLIIGGVMQ